MGRLFDYTIIGNSRGKKMKKGVEKKMKIFVFSFEDEKKNRVEVPIVISRFPI